MNTIEKLKDEEFGNVITSRDPSDVHNRKTNIIQRIKTSGDFEWGYSGQGSQDFAFNILLHFSNGNEAFSRKHASEFQTRFVTTLPRAGGTIQKEFILEFIKEKELS